MKPRSAWSLLPLVIFLGRWASAIDSLPQEPMEIGTTPQYFLDDYGVDNRWALKQKTEEVVRVFHAPVKFAGNPLISGDGGCGYVSAVRDPATGMIRLWYQTSEVSGKADDEGADYGIAYAESKDGLKWDLPKLGLVNWKGTKENNVVWRGPTGSRASGQQILELPERDRRGQRYVMAYRTAGGRGKNGIRVIGSQDGIHWDLKSDSLVSLLPSDTVNSIVYDPARREYVMYCRAKNAYRIFQGDIIDTGESRRIARMASPDLWSEWKSSPQNILIPDEQDLAHGFNRFYGMPAAHRDGVYWGFLLSFKLNTDIWTELAWSRNGIGFERFPGRPRLLDLGPPGAWDDGMVFGGPWVEVGDEWWLYYSGWDGPHETRDRKGAIGLAKIRKEGFVALRGPAGGGVIVTRQLRWPGGKLLVNVDARQGELKVRVSDERRKPLAGFDYADGQVFKGNAVAQEVTWNGKSLDALKGRVIRLEFFLRNADLFSFRSTGG
jgi:hypothetical protein